MIAFFICWAPFHVQRLIAIHGTNSDRITSNSQWIEFLYLLMTYISGVLYYLSTTINPILYNIMSNKFRVAFMVSTFALPMVIRNLSVFHIDPNNKKIPYNIEIPTSTLYACKTFANTNRLTKSLPFFMIH